MKKNAILFLSVAFLSLASSKAAYSLDRTEFLKNKSTVSEISSVIESGKFTENFSASIEAVYLFRKRNAAASQFFSCTMAKTAVNNYKELLIRDSDEKQYWIPLSRDMCDKIEKNYRKNDKIIFYVVFFFKEKSKQYNYDIMSCDFIKADRDDKMQYW
ncbi:MAG: hypothetical protein JW982_16290 [Spirochaetes bacterium]|nr:hypothetical protein [Spirochaetota bacterium]